MRRSVKSISPAIVRSYDIRGRFGEQLTCDDAYTLGVAYAAVAARRNLWRAAVCRDGRLSSPALENALVDGMVAGGLQVYPMGLGPTPLLHYAVRAAELQGGIMVTGSHNPRDENGFKLLLDGQPVFGEALRELVAAPLALRDGGALRPEAALSGSLLRSYVAKLAQIAADMPPRHVVWDCGNGAAGAVIESLTQQLPGRHVLLNARVDGRFPAHHPDPAVAQNLRQLQQAVLAQRADLGIAFDGDGDRIGVVDSDGLILWPDQLLLFLALDVLGQNPGATIVGDVKSSRVLFSEVERLGGRPVMAPSGYVLVRQVAIRERARLAGEMSGHILFADCWHRTDDALFAAMRLLSALGRRDMNLAQFRAGLPPTVATPEMRIPCPEERKAAVVHEVRARLMREGADLNTVDGLRVSTPHGWWLLRTSGTEAKLTARCEAADAAGLDFLQTQLSQQLHHSGIECPTVRGC
jgi:phosphomannomutase